MPGISLTQKEEQVIFNYFNLTGSLTCPQD